MKAILSIEPAPHAPGYLYGRFLSARTGRPLVRYCGAVTTSVTTSCHSTQDGAYVARRSVEAAAQRAIEGGYGGAYGVEIVYVRWTS